MRYSASLLSIPALSLALATGASGAIISNDFESVTPGTFVVGAPLGVAARLGNASGGFSSSVVNSTSLAGINGSNGLGGNDLALRSRAVHDITQKTTFDFFFQFEPTRFGTSIGAGWARTATQIGGGGNSTGTDGGRTFGDGRDNRALVGLQAFGDTFGDVDPTTDGDQIRVRPGFTGQISLFDALADTEAELTVGNWYQFAFDLAIDLGTIGDSEITYNVTDLSLVDRGSDGVSGGATVLSVAAADFVSSTSGSNFDAPGNDATGFAFIAGNGQRGVGVIDNVNVSSLVPEPASIALLGLGSLLVTCRRRH